MDSSWKLATTEKRNLIVKDYLKATFIHGTTDIFDKIIIPGLGKDYWKSELVDKTWTLGGAKDDEKGVFSLCAEMYKMLRLSKLTMTELSAECRDHAESIRSLESTKQTLEAEILSLKAQNLELVDRSSNDLKDIIKSELSAFKTDLKQELNEQFSTTMTGTDKKWSDLFKSNQQVMKDQNKKANAQRKELEKTIASNKRQSAVDNIERQKRASNVCVNLIPESTQAAKKDQEKENRASVIDILKVDEDDVQHVFRAGSVSQDKPRSLIVFL